MVTLFLDRKDLGLRLSSGALTFVERGGKRGSVPLRHLDRVVLRGAVHLNASVLGALTQAGVSVTLLSGRHSRYLATCTGRAHNDVVRRLGQFDMFQDMRARTAWAHELIEGKTAAQLRLLATALERRPDKRRALTQANRRLREIQARLSSRSSSIASVRGFEGAAAAAYFQGLRACFPPSLEFTARRRRPPPDPVNACLSLGYTLLHADAVAVCHGAGLDPMLGLFHEPSFGRESLAADVIESLRPRIDEWVWGMFRERKLTRSAFHDDNGAVLLGKAGRRRFYARIDPLRSALSRLLRREVGRLARNLADRGSRLLASLDRNSSWERTA